MNIFDEKCIECKDEMICLHENGKDLYGTEYIYWCPNCGTILRWYDSFPIRDRDWMLTKK